MTVAIVIAVAAIGLAAGVATLRLRAGRRAARRRRLRLVGELYHLQRLSDELAVSLERFRRAAALRRLLAACPPGATSHELLQWVADTAASLDNVSAAVARATTANGASLVAARGLPPERADAQTIAWPDPAPRGVSFAFDYGDGGETGFLRSGLAVPLRPAAPGAEFVAVFSPTARVPAEALVDTLESLAARAVAELDRAAAPTRPGGAPAPPEGGRRAFHDTLARAVATAHRDGARLTLTLFEVDDLAQLGSSAGPLGVDDTLGRVHAVARAAAGDALACRFGLSGLAVVAEGAGVTAAEQMLAGIRASLRPAGLSISAGIAELDHDDDWLDLLAYADAALRHAQAAGRGTAVIARALARTPSPERAALPR